MGAAGHRVDDAHVWSSAPAPAPHGRRSMTLSGEETRRCNQVDKSEILILFDTVNIKTENTITPFLPPPLRLVHEAVSALEAWVARVSSPLGRPATRAGHTLPSPHPRGSRE